MPVPKKGILSTKDMKKAFFIGLCKPSTLKPMESSTKVR